MDITTLESSLPAAIATATSLLASTEVLVQRERPVATTTDPYLWVRPLGEVAEGHGLGSQRLAYPYECLYFDTAGTQARQQQLFREVREAFHGARSPGSITGLHWAEFVAELGDLDIHSDEVADLAGAFQLVFHGDGRT